MKLILPLLLLSVPVFGQNTLWKKTAIGKDASVLFPGAVTTQDFTVGDTGKMALYFSQSDTTLFFAEYRYQYFDAENGRDLEKGYEGFFKGMTGTGELKSFRHMISDTSLGGTSGKFIRSVDTSGKVVFAYLYHYVTVANGHFYVFSLRSRQALDIQGQDIQGQMDEVHFFRSIKFAGPIKENAPIFAEKDLPSVLGYTTGRFLFVFLLLGGIGYLCYRLIRRLSRR